MQEREGACVQRSYLKSIYRINDKDVVHNSLLSMIIHISLITDMDHKKYRKRYVHGVFKLYLTIYFFQ